MAARTGALIARGVPRHFVSYKWLTLYDLDKSPPFVWRRENS
jgi:hypothetical protein